MKPLPADSPALARLTDPEFMKLVPTRGDVEAFFMPGIEVIALGPIHQGGGQQRSIMHTEATISNSLWVYYQVGNVYYEVPVAYYRPSGKRAHLAGVRTPERMAPLKVLSLLGEVKENPPRRTPKGRRNPGEDETVYQRVKAPRGEWSRGRRTPFTWTLTGTHEKPWKLNIWRGVNEWFVDLFNYDKGSVHWSYPPTLNYEQVAEVALEEANARIFNPLEVLGSLKQNPKPVPGFIDPRAEEAAFQAKRVYKFLVKVFHPDQAILNREKRGLPPLNEGVWHHETMYKLATGAYELAGSKSKAERLKGYGDLNRLLKPFLGGPDDPTPHVVRDGERIVLELPENYVPRQGGVGGKRAERISEREEEVESLEASQVLEWETHHVRTLQEAARYWLKKKYGTTLWALMGEGRHAGRGRAIDPLQKERVNDAVAKWFEVPGRPAYAAKFLTLGVIPSAVKARAITWSPAVQQFMDTMEVAAGAVHREHINEDRATLHKETAEKQERRASDVWTTATPRTPEEELGYRRGESEEFRVEEQLAALTDALATLEAEGDAGRAKADIIRMHLGDEILPQQPARLLGRIDSKGVRRAQTSRAYQDLSGEIWRLNQKGQLVEKGQATKYHPFQPDRGCPTCSAIFRFVRVRNMGPAEVARIIDDFSATPITPKIHKF